MMFSTQTRSDFSLEAMTETFNKVLEKFKLDKSNSKMFALWLRTFSGMADVSRLNRDNEIMWQVNNTITVQPSDADTAYEKAMIKSFKLCDYALETLEGLSTASELIELLEWVD